MGLVSKVAITPPQRESVVVALRRLCAHGRVVRKRNTSAMALTEGMREKGLQIIALRKQDKTFPEIASQLGIKVSYARNLASLVRNLAKERGSLRAPGSRLLLKFFRLQRA